MNTSNLRKNQRFVSGYITEKNSVDLAAHLKEVFGRTRSNKATLQLPEKRERIKIHFGKGTDQKTFTVENVKLKKMLKTGRRLSKDAYFSRAAQLIQQDESSETTAKISENFGKTLEINKDFYDKLLLNSSR